MIIMIIGGTAITGAAVIVEITGMLNLGALREDNRVVRKAATLKEDR